MSGYSSELISKERKLLHLQSKVSELASSPTRRNTMKRLNIGLLMLCILSGIVGISYLLFDPVVRSVVLSKLTLSRTSETFYIWEDPPISPHLKVYFWNFTNAESFFAGLEKPNLEEVGPYTYRQKWLKQNITWHPNGTISYRTRKIFTFSPDDSCSGCSDLNDLITTINVPAVSAYYQMREAYWTGFILKGMIHGLDYRMWTTKSPKDLLWGHEEKLFDIARHTMPDPPPFSQFGFFLTKNSTKEEDLGLYTMYTGEGDPYKLATIAAFNGKNSLGRWNDSDCDKVHGSDGASFNPYIQQKDTLWFFNDQLCRAMPLVFKKEVDREGLPGYRYGPREDVFMSQRFPDENACYGVEGGVLGDGVFDVTTCQFNAPIVLSWPHFLHAEQKFRDEVNGLSPDVNEHGFWFDIQPTTGTTLSAKARLQINVMVRRSSIFDDLGDVNSTVVPVLWFEEGIDKLGDDIVKVLKTAAVDPAIYRQYILYLFIALMSCVLLLCFSVLCLCCSNRTSVAKVEKVREHVHDMLGPSTYDTEQAVQPFLESTDSSRTNSACHSRNCSEGTRPPYILAEGKSDKLMDILHINRALPYNTMQEVVVSVPDKLVVSGEGEGEKKVEEEGEEEEEEKEELDSLPELDEDEEDDEDEDEDEDSGEEDEGREPTDVLILPRQKKTSLSFSS